MTTYNTYQEAKIANPESNIYIHTGEFLCEKSIRPSSWTYESRGFKLCNPADHCITVEKFLADGHKFVEGDVIINANENVNIITQGDAKMINGEGGATFNDTRFILRAAALETKEPKRTKVEYVEVKDSIFDLRPDFEAGELYLKSDSLGWLVITGHYDLMNNHKDGKVYRRVETPMTWKEELYDYLDSSCEMSDDFDDSFTIEIEGKPLEFNLNDDEFVDMCKFVASLNSVN